MKIGYFGLPLGAHLLLRDGHELDPCVLSPLPAPGRRRVAARVPTGTLIDALGAPKKELNQRIAAALERARPELIVSWFWTRLLPAAWLNATRYGGIGVHPSLLPRHRGPNPYFWSIDCGDLEAGVTLHTLAPEYDTGTLLLQRAIPVGGAQQLATRARARSAFALLIEGGSGALRALSSTRAHRAGRASCHVGSRADRPGVGRGLALADRARIAPDSRAFTGSGLGGRGERAAFLRHPSRKPPLTTSQRSSPVRRQ